MLIEDRIVGEAQSFLPAAITGREAHIALLHVLKA